MTKGGYGNEYDMTKHAMAKTTHGNGMTKSAMTMTMHSYSMTKHSKQIINCYLIKYLKIIKLINIIY